MSEEISARAITNDSADLTITKEYLVVKGKHFQMRNGYLYRSNQTQAISVKDILSMEYLTIRSKRLLIIFMVLMTLVVFSGAGVRKMLTVTRQVDQEVQKVENVYNYVSDEDIDISVTGSIMSAFSNFGIKGIIIVYMILVLGSVGCLLLYFLKPFRVLYISSLGKIIAVEKRFYEKTKLECIVKEWKMLNDL